MKISELRAAFEAMTPGEWWISDLDGDVMAGPNDVDAKHVGPVDWRHPDLMGSIATHNAMPVLLEIVEAALAADSALIEFENWKEPDARFMELLLNARQTRATLRAALSKVTR